MNVSEAVPLMFASNVSAMLEPQAILKSVIAVYPVGVVIVDPLGNIMLANGELERMFGYASDEIVGQPVDMLIPTNLRAQHARHRMLFATHAEIRVAKNRRLCGRHKDGTELPVEVGLCPVHTSEGILVLGVIVDISDRLRTERLKDEFVATVSHELRTPLTSIGGALGLLVGNAGGILPSSATRLLTIAYANSQRLIRLVNDILTMEKIESGKVAFVLKRIEVQSLVKRAIEANQAFAEPYGVRMRLDPSSTAGEIRADSDWVFQIVTNLLSNAIKFSPSGEEVVVAIAEHGGMIRITVRDHGRGIPNDFKPYIFEKFAQANATDARQQGGTGLGLSIVKQIVTRLGGEVSFCDAPGGGAIFQVELPAWDSKDATSSQFGSRSHAATPAKNRPEVLL
jgi:PAS domain S-box-containing protein